MPPQEGSLPVSFWEKATFQSVLLFLVAFLLFVDLRKRRRPEGYPPGPFRLPFLGNIFHLNLQMPTGHLQKLVGKYGNLFSLEFGKMRFVLVTGMKQIKEVLARQDENLDNRPEFPIRNEIFPKASGLLMSNGPVWKQHRRFTLMTLRNLGLGKRSLQERIQEEASFLVQEMEEERGEAFDPHFKINNAVSNIICGVTFGERFDYFDPHFQELLRLLDSIIGLEARIWGQLFNAFPSIMRWLPGPHREIFRKWSKLKAFTSDMIRRHREDRNPDEPRDFIDAYLGEMAKEKDAAGSYLNEDNLMTSTLDLFLAGTETSSTALRWALLHMALNPEIQETAQAEIDGVVGRSRPPTMDDRESMPYTCAVINEVLRMGNIVPLNVPRETGAHTTVGGYHLPKGTVVVTNLTALHRDPAEWETPDKFNPQHFLDNGQLKKKESFLPFSMGKRMCLGEQLARTELFIFFTCLLRNFTFRAPEGVTLSLRARNGITLSPFPYRICAVPR
ncbi:cytochrome P450 2J2 [Tachyglossus aculeatus]|uniref:cytochrome P450 2J2 n=1 Tax=Tachyglossus aculeatus TaxID=9261 RepID=UPI0018F4BB86|nr:cytochrome P450 2J2 [Tachyglossus aculeatus]